ncbi:S-adenosylmethionine-dependent methyltransferase-like protein [Haloferax elongans ATCC BAA-1513]|uniref:S-adenosylmethionine-dependent methyltransferase-like protein n=1 Tax=Haloferax elongans ATCC BAA-1513 TaxID=1230453 RepID=M0HPY2_HALEO|nr:FkbM family methyltransferase [Haloferax elongans]ELZ86541.1 S-adenosylmethionine-dependent methyltransferase-like protein [Haloferax elongans ATCC BAA-1513]
MSFRHPLTALRHYGYLLHYGLVRKNYEYRLVAPKKRVGQTKFRSYELYNRHGSDVLLKALLLNLDRSDVVVDVGANTGTYSLAAAANAPSAEVVAVEPNPEVADQLRANVEANPFDDRIRVLECGLGHTDGTREFHLSNYDELGSFSSAHASAWEAQVVETTPVPMRSLDSLVESDAVPPPDHLKIDVEGFGVNVLRGARRVLRTYRPIVYFELHDSRGGHDESVAKNLLREAGYELIPVREGWVGEPTAKTTTPKSA